MRKLIIIFFIIGFITIISTYYYVRQIQQSIILEEDVKIIDIEIDKRNDILVSITLLNKGEPLILERISLVKIQTMLTIASSKFSTPIILYKENITKIPIGFKLDREGADYFLYIFTNKGTAIRCNISYP
ncbi:MAG: hypothetical protein QXW62_00130 [Candidatus Methanomethylicaceae archaeon]|nr:hypothetical protein [Candidatus Verstraetearchaeota archaeon]